MGKWSEAMEDGAICPHCFSTLITDDGSLIPCDCGESKGATRQAQARPLSDEERKQFREATNREADRRLERKQCNEWEAERARILRANRERTQDE